MITDEQAKAFQELFKMGNTAMEKAADAGSYLSKLAFDPLKELSGFATDEIRARRQQRAFERILQSQRILLGRGIEPSQFVGLSDKMTVELIDGASLEEDFTLQGMWSKLIADSMDPNYRDCVHPGFIDVIKQLTPDEALILQYLAQLPSFPTSYIPGFGNRPHTNEERLDEYLRAVQIKRRSLIPIYIDNLERLRLFELRSVHNAVGDQKVLFTDFGKTFLEAVFEMPPKAKP